MSCSTASERSTKRLAQVRSVLAKEKIDALFVRNQSNIAWLTAFDGVFDEEDAHAVMLDGSNACIHSDSRYSGALRTNAQGGPFTVDDRPLPHGRFAAQAVQDLAKAQEKKPEELCLAIERTMALGEYRTLQDELAHADAGCAVKETDGLIVGLRSVKDEDEVHRMEQAQAITDAAFEHIVGFMRAGMTERQVQIELEDFMRRHGAEGLAFPSIVATGPNGAKPHSVPGNTVLEEGQCVVMDFGARAQGYCSDMTRTVFVGNPCSQLKNAYATLRRANEECEAMIAAGVLASAVHDHSQKVLEDGGFGGTMGHALGHGVGIDIHESPVLAPRFAQPLQVGNVVTVEPGIYIPDAFGMRLEDFGVVTQEGYRVFTQSTHDMVII